VSAQTDRKRCEIAEASVKFENVKEEQENRRTRRKQGWTIKTSRSASEGATSNS
jgi:hypothetical protein